jgi:hypothetical protein
MNVVIRKFCIAFLLTIHLVDVGVIRRRGNRENKKSNTDKRLASSCKYAILNEMGHNGSG